MCYILKYYTQQLLNELENTIIELVKFNASA